jgi:hypothetical protein
MYVCNPHTCGQATVSFNAASTAPPDTAHKRRRLTCTPPMKRPTSIFSTLTRRHQHASQLRGAQHNETVQIIHHPASPTNPQAVTAVIPSSHCLPHVVVHHLFGTLASAQRVGVHQRACLVPISIPPIPIDTQTLGQGPNHCCRTQTVTTVCILCTAWHQHDPHHNMRHPRFCQWWHQWILYGRCCVTTS